MQRLLLNRLWVEAVYGDVMSLIFGMDVFEHGRLLNSTIGKVAHNSFIQKTVEFGLVYTISLLLFALRCLPFSVFSIFVLYSLFLHNVLSVPWVIAASIYLNVHDAE